MDFTPGIFDITAGKKDIRKRVQSTLANQLALYVVIYSPLHMAADLPENYEKHPEAFQFIKDVPTDWERSRTLDARIGDYIVVARQQRNGRGLVPGRADGRAAAINVGRCWIFCNQAAAIRLKFIATKPMRTTGPIRSLT